MFIYLSRLLERLNNEKFSTEFFIDASHEFSMFVWNNGKGHKLSPAPYFCQQRKNGCAIYSKPYATCVSYTYIYCIVCAPSPTDIHENKKIYFKAVHLRD